MLDTHIVSLVLGLLADARVGDDADHTRGQLKGGLALSMVDGHQL
jgi:hypothetical protein